jgi:hypothetical protein
VQEGGQEGGQEGAGGEGIGEEGGGRGGGEGRGGGRGAGEGEGFISMLPRAAESVTQVVEVVVKKKRDTRLMDLLEEYHGAQRCKTKVIKPSTLNPQH